MRLFFALWPDDCARESLSVWLEALRAVCGGRSVRPENLHLTLAFLGEVSDRGMPDVVRAAAKVTLGRAHLLLDRPGYWRHNRIAWAGATVVPAALAVLVSGLRGALAEAAVHFDPKKFVPHVTLLRNARAPDRLPALEPVVWRIEDFVLVASRGAPDGSRYAVLQRWST